LMEPSTYNIQHNCTNFGVQVGSHHFIAIFSLVLFLCLLPDFISQPWHERAGEFDLLPSGQLSWSQLPCGQLPL